MIIARYLVKEVLVTLAALTCLLLLIFLSNQFVQYISRAASGNIPSTVVLRLMMLETPNLLGLLLPLAFYMAILLAYGRLYAENEMLVLQVCGFSQRQLMFITLSFATVVSLIVALLVLYVNPVVAKHRDHLLTGEGVAAALKMVVPGHFQSISSGKRVFYVEEAMPEKQQARFVFLAERGEKPLQQGVSTWNVVTADRASLEERRSFGGEFLTLQNGYQYVGIPGEQDYRIVKFDKYHARLPTPAMRLRHPERTMSTKQLRAPYHITPVRKSVKTAELQWRISILIMPWVLALLALPMSRVYPRQGKYAKILPALLIYMLYANMMFVSRDWIIEKVVSPKFGIWWIHIVMVSLALFLLYSPKLKSGVRHYLSHR